MRDFTNLKLGNLWVEQGGARTRHRVMKWVKTYSENHALDARIYAMSALHIDCGEVVLNIENYQR